MGDPVVPDMSERARMIGHVWYSALVGWINGWSTMARVYDELAVSVRLLLSDRAWPRLGRLPAGAPWRWRRESAGSGQYRRTPMSTPSPSRGLPIEISGLTKHFGSVLAVDHLDFIVEPGRVTGFLGPERLGQDHHPAHAARTGHPERRTRHRRRAALPRPPQPVGTVGAVLEATSFHPARRARTHLRMVARAGGHDEARADVVLDLVGLTADASARSAGSPWACGNGWNWPAR